MKYSAYIFIYKLYFKLRNEKKRRKKKIEYIYTFKNMVTSKVKTQKVLNFNQIIRSPENK